MRLSKLSTDKALDILCEITPYINNIVIDDTLITELKNKIDPKGNFSKAEILAFGVQKINTLIPIVLKEHRADIYGVLSVLNEKTPEEIARQNFIQTGTQIREAVKDKELIDFFKSCAEQEESE